MAPVTTDPAPAPAPPAPPALTPEQIRAIEDARARSGTIRRAVAWARIDGWSIGVFGALTLLLGITSPVGWLVGLGLLAAAYVELTSATRLKHFDPVAPRWLGWNQVGLGVLLLSYAGWGIWNALYGRVEFIEQIIAQAPELAELTGDMEALVRGMTVLVFAIVAGVAVVVPGLQALYYFTRERHVREFLARTPAWVRDVM